jgi:hypothetical protein
MMGAAMEMPSMGKQRGRPQSERNDVSVKLDRTLVGKARLVATHRGVTMAELLSEIIRGPLDRYYGQMVKELGIKEGGHK